jgi:hypothetical protein
MKDMLPAQGSSLDGRAEPSTHMTSVHGIASWFDILWSKEAASELFGYGIDLDMDTVTLYVEIHLML